MSTPPDTPEYAAVLVYLGERTSTFEEDDVIQAFIAESQLQGKACRSDAATEPALLDALCRRVHRSLTMRNLPLGVQPLGDGGYIRPGAEDAEIRRLERPFRKLVLG